MENSYTLVNNITGEIINGNYHLDTLERKRHRKEAFEKTQEFEKFKKVQSKYMGNFIFFLYNSLDKLMEVLTDSDLCKYIMLSTYIKTNGYLMLDNNKTYIDKKTMKEILLVSRANFNKFYNNILENKLLIKDGDTYRINLNIFWRGKEKDYKSITGNKLEDYTRIYINVTRELYKLNYRKTKKLTIAYKLIPYINWKYNVLCKNIRETLESKIDPLDISNVMDILGYSKKHIAKFKQDFYGIKFYDYVLFKTLQDQPDYKTSIILVNPLFAYRNKIIKDIEYLFRIFNIKNRSLT